MPTGLKPFTSKPPKLIKTIHAVTKNQTTNNPRSRGQDPVVSAIEQRIAEWTHLPPDHGEPIQVLRYSGGQKYGAHWDWFDDPLHGGATAATGGGGAAAGGAATAGGKTATPPKTTRNRAATVLMYLGDVTSGGETALPIAEPLDWARQVGDKGGRSECARNGTLAVFPRRGDALLFWDMLPDGRTVCRRSLHASCPTLAGTKFTATKWIHNGPYGYEGYDALKLAARCADQKPGCRLLAEEGACDDRPNEMIGLLGQCRLACGDCVECAESDLLCLRRNLRSQRAARKAAGEL